MTGGEQFRTEPRTKLNPPARSPTPQESKQLSAIVIGWLVKHIMTNFLYSFGGEERRQGEGGESKQTLTGSVKVKEDITKLQFIILIIVILPFIKTPNFDYQS